MNKKNKSFSEDKVIYKISLDNKSLGFLNPHLFVEKLRDEITSKMPSINVRVVHYAKSEKQQRTLIELNCLSTTKLPDYQVNNLQEEINFIAIKLRDELIDKIEEAQRSVA